MYIYIYIYTHIYIYIYMSTSGGRQTPMRAETPPTSESGTRSRAAT